MKIHDGVGGGYSEYSQNIYDNPEKEDYYRSTPDLEEH